MHEGDVNVNDEKAASCEMKTRSVMLMKLMKMLIWFLTRNG